VIEREFGERLDWQELPGRKAMRVVLYRHNVDPSDEKQYPELQAWMLAKMDRFLAVFAPRIKALPTTQGTELAAADPRED
jgi:hypothetical protein